MNVGALVQTAMNAVPSTLKAAVTFTRTTQSENAATGQLTPTTTTVKGTASRGSGNPLRYQALGLVLSEAPTLTFVPSTSGQLPLPGDEVTWGGVKYTVKDVEPIAPAGTALAASVVIAR